LFADFLLSKNIVPFTGTDAAFSDWYLFKNVIDGTVLCVFAINPVAVAEE